MPTMRSAAPRSHSKSDDGDGGDALDNNAPLENVDDSELESCPCCRRYETFMSMGVKIKMVYDSDTTLGYIFKKRRRGGRTPTP